MFQKPCSPLTGLTQGINYFLRTMSWCTNAFKKNLTPGYLHGRFQYRSKLTKETQGTITTRRARYRLAAGQIKRLLPTLTVQQKCIIPYLML